MGPESARGVEPIELPGFSYLPRFITAEESEWLLRYFGSLKPIWETRYAGTASAREGQGPRRLTRPVYWLGAWQFACLGYYTVQHQHEKCLRAEPMPPELVSILQRLAPRLAPHQGGAERLPNTCLINYYGSELTLDAKGRPQPVDYARLKMHRDGEPGPVVMFSLGQPAHFEFVDGDKPETPELSMWLANRSVVLFSGEHFKDRLYHRVTRVRHGDSPVMPAPLTDFRLRRISVSFRYVPDEHVKSLREFSSGAQAQIRGYVEELAKSSAHFRRELE